MSQAFVLIPKPISDAMLFSSTIAEPDAASGEVVWNAADNHAIGDRRIRTQTHTLYECNVAGVNATPPEDTLLLTIPRWIKIRPTNKWAAFDGTINTQSISGSPVVYVLRPGVFNAIALYGLKGATCSISLKDAPGGTVVYTQDLELLDDPIDHWDYRFGSFRQLTKALFTGIEPYIDPELTITILADVPGDPVGAGLVVIGDMRELSFPGQGGTQFGAQVKPTTYSYIDFNAYGDVTIQPRPGATDMDITVRLDIEDVNGALETLIELIDIPIAVIGSDVVQFAGLNVFGLMSGSVSYDGPKHAILNISVKGLI